MKQIITVRKKGDKLVDVLRRLVEDQDAYYMIFIEKEFIDRNKLIKISDYEYKLKFDRYEFILDATLVEKENSEWYWLWYLKQDDKYHYSCMNWYLFDYVNKKCGYKNIFIRKWGSKAKIEVPED